MPWPPCSALLTNGASDLFGLRRKIKRPAPRSNNPPIVPPTIPPIAPADNPLELDVVEALVVLVVNPETAVLIVEVLPVVTEVA